MERELARELLLALAGNPGLDPTKAPSAFRSLVATWDDQFGGVEGPGKAAGPGASSGNQQKRPARQRAGERADDLAFRAWQAIRASKGLAANSYADFEVDIKAGTYSVAELESFITSDGPIPLA